MEDNDKRVVSMPNIVPVTANVFNKINEYLTILNRHEDSVDVLNVMDVDETEIGGLLEGIMFSKNLFKHINNRLELLGHIDYPILVSDNNEVYNRLFIEKVKLNSNGYDYFTDSEKINISMSNHKHELVVHETLRIGETIYVKMQDATINHIYRMNLVKHDAIANKQLNNIFMFYMNTIKVNNCLKQKRKTEITINEIYLMLDQEDNCNDLK